MTTLHASVGGIVFNERGEVLLRRSSRIRDGEMWTFPKGHPRDGETDEHCAVREVLEETGVEARVIGRLPGRYTGTTTTSTYFMMTVERETGVFDEETTEVRWVSLADAAELISRSPYAAGRVRDLQIVTAVTAITT